MKTDAAILRDAMVPPVRGWDALYLWKNGPVRGWRERVLVDKSSGYAPFGNSRDYPHAEDWMWTNFSESRVIVRTAVMEKYEPYLEPL